MFKVSQDITLNTRESRNPNNGIFGTYRKSPDNDYYDTNLNSVYVSSEVTDNSRIQILHFPIESVPVDSETNFIIKKNGVKGNFEVKVEHPNNQISNSIPLQIIDPERLAVHFTPTTEGLYKVHIKCNLITVPGSPFYLFAQHHKYTPENFSTHLPVFHSNPKKVCHRGDGLRIVKLNTKNEFIIDGSNAGNNIFFTGICGPKGQCSEVSVKHMGKNIYLVTYWVKDPGEYLIAAKWGDDHIPGSPFHLVSE